MSLFKIFKGNKENLDAQPKKDGFAWFTKQDAGFYIDTEMEDGSVVRKRVNSAESTEYINDYGFSGTASNAKEALDIISTSIIKGTYDESQESLNLEVPSPKLDGETLFLYSK